MGRLKQTAGWTVAASAVLSVPLAVGVAAFGSGSAATGSRHPGPSEAETILSLLLTAAVVVAAVGLVAWALVLSGGYQAAAWPFIRKRRGPRAHRHEQCESI